MSTKRSSPTAHFGKSEGESSFGTGKVEVPGPGAYGNLEQHKQLIPTRSNIRNPNSIATTAYDKQWAD